MTSYVPSGPDISVKNQFRNEVLLVCSALALDIVSRSGKARRRDVCCFEISRIDRCWRYSRCRRDVGLGNDALIDVVFEVIVITEHSQQVVQKILICLVSEVVPDYLRAADRDARFDRVHVGRCYRSRGIENDLSVRTDPYILEADVPVVRIDLIVRLIAVNERVAHLDLINQIELIRAFRILGCQEDAADISHGRKRLAAAPVLGDISCHSICSFSLHGLHRVAADIGDPRQMIAQALNRVFHLEHFGNLAVLIDQPIKLALIDPDNDDIAVLKSSFRILENEILRRQL